VSLDWLDLGGTVRAGLSQFVDNNEGNSWNNTISAIETFNMPSTQVTVFYQDDCWSGFTDTMQGNALISYVGNAYNDNLSSLSTPNTGIRGSC
jgi:hypothetical protein